MKYTKQCPECKKEISFSDIFALNRSIKNNCLCNSCSKSGERNPVFGLKINTGKRPKWHCDNISNGSKRKQFSEEHKRKLRIRSIEQHKKNGISFPAIDSGCLEEFENLNLYNGFNIQYPNIEIRDLGYFVDGYDPVLHAVFEYDTKSHLTRKYIEKDLIRQNEIMEYYKSIGKPLTSFYRINRTGVGDQGMRDVLNTSKKD